MLSGASGSLKHSFLVRFSFNFYHFDTCSFHDLVLTFLVSYYNDCAALHLLFLYCGPLFLGTILHIILGTQNAFCWFLGRTHRQSLLGYSQRWQSLVIVPTACDVAAAWPIVTLLSNLSAIFPIIPLLKKAPCGKEFCLHSSYNLNSHELVFYRT